MNKELAAILRNVANDIESNDQQIPVGDIWRIRIELTCVYVDCRVKGPDGTYVSNENAEPASKTFEIPSMAMFPPDPCDCEGLPE